MCLGVVGKIEKIDNDMAIANIMGVRRRISIVLVPQIKISEYVVIHAGFAINPIDEKEAKKTEAILKEVKKYE